MNDNTAKHAEILHWGMWQLPYKAINILCQDGKRRTAKITGSPDTFFSIPACISYQGKTVTGFIMGTDNPTRDLMFYATGKHRDIFTHLDASLYFMQLAYHVGRLRQLERETWGGSTVAADEFTQYDAATAELIRVYFGSNQINLSQVHRLFNASCYRSATRDQLEKIITENTPIDPDR